MKRKVGIVTGLLLVALATLLFVQSGHSPQNPVDFVSPIFPEGHYTYEIKAESQGTLDTGAMVHSPGPRQEIQSSFAGKLEVIATPGLLQLSISDISGQIMRQDATQEFETIKQEVIRVLVDKEGRFVTFQSQKELGSLGSAVWVSILSEIQVMKNAQYSNRWTTQESDHQFTYQADYRLNGQQLEKKRSQIVGHKAFASTVGGTMVLDDDQSWKATLENGLLQELKSHYRLSMQQKDQNSFQNLQDFQLKLIKTSKLDTLAEWQPSVSLVYDSQLLDQLTLKKSEASRYQDEAKSITFDDIAAAMTETLDQNSETELYKKVRAFIYLHPERCKEFVPILRAAPYGEIATRVLGVALGRIGHPKAQETLREVIQGRLDEHNVVTNYVHLLSQSSQPTDETMKFLDRLSSDANADIREAGLLAGGTALSSYRRLDQVQAAAYLEKNLSRLEKAQDPATRHQLIDYLGNSEMVEALPRLVSLIEQGRTTEERRLAIEALRSMDSTEARALLLGFLQSNSLVDQMAAVRAVNFQTFMPEVLPLAQAVVKRAVALEAPVRHGYMRWMVTHEAHIPDLGVRLSSALETETDVDNQKFIRASLDMLGHTAAKPQ